MMTTTPIVRGPPPILLFLVLIRSHTSIVDAVPLSNPTVTDGDDGHIGDRRPWKAYPCDALAIRHTVADVNSPARSSPCTPVSGSSYRVTA
jgi:hypothetical protein